MSASDRLLTAEAAAEYAAVSVKTVRRWYRSGVLPCIKLNRRWVRIRQSDLDKFLDSQRFHVV